MREEQVLIGLNHGLFLPDFIKRGPTGRAGEPDEAGQECSEPA